jgi:hypothetical protein
MIFKIHKTYAPQTYYFHVQGYKHAVSLVLTFGEHQHIKIESAFIHKIVKN